jgi:serine/threonine protein phosphatase 1
MRLLFITDIHGNYDAMLQLFNNADFDPSSDTLVVGGDMIDRGPDSGKMLKGIKLLHQMYPKNIKVLIGNHELMMLEFFRRNHPLWHKHGGIKTQKNLEQFFSNGEVDNYLQWIDGLPVVHETEKFVFTHAGVNPGFPLQEQQREVLWMNRKEFNDTVDLSSLQKLTKGRIILHGHTPVRTLAFDGVRMDCDLGSGVLPSYLAALALVDLTNDKYYRYSFRNNKVDEHTLGLAIKLKTLSKREFPDEKI